MAKAHFVKKARKDNPAVKKGQSYWWWKFRNGSKQYSAVQPKLSQLTQSEFLSQWYCIEETLIADIMEVDRIRNTEDAVWHLQTSVDNAIEDLEILLCEQEEKRGNMPDHLQDSDTGTLLEERAYACSDWIDALGSVDFNCSIAEIVDEIEQTCPGC